MLDLLPNPLLNFLRKIKRMLTNYKKAKFRENNPINWHNLRVLEPTSRLFGFDRGTPIDRIYTDDFLSKNRHYIKGVVCEIAESTYSKRFDSGVKKFEILHYANDNPKATIIGDLTKYDDLPKDYLDCFICTATLNFIYDYKKAIRGIYSMLNRGGVALVSVCGLTQISRYDYERWGDYYRFCDMGIRRDFEEVFGAQNVEVEVYGNVLAAIAELHGISAEELSKDEIMHKDSDYQILITLVAKKFKEKI